jgi:uncharacterized Zn-finger protein
MIIMAPDKNTNIQPLRKPAETIKVSANVDEVVCDGGIGPLGHPQVWYVFDKTTEVSCHYCGRRFVKD